MEATEIITPEETRRTIVLNEEESRQYLSNLTSEQTIEILNNPNVSVIESNISNISSEEFERILDEAVGINNNTVDVESIEVEPIVEPTVESTTESTTESTESIESTTDNINNTLSDINYNTKLESVITSRFSGAEWFNIIRKKIIIIGGVGGIGSWLTFLLSRTNVNSIYIYDDDVVEEVNLAGQFFSNDNISTSKVFAIRNNIRTFSNYYSLNCISSKYDINSYTSQVMMGCFDNMEARKIFFNKWKSKVNNSSTKEEYLLLDGRLSAETLQVFCIQGDDSEAIEVYEKQYLFSDEMAEVAPCSYKQTSFMANMIAATMVNTFVNWCANQADSYRPVPFFIEYDAITMQYKFKMNAL